MVERVVEIFERIPFWLREIEKETVPATFRESDSHPNHAHVGTFWKMVWELESRPLLEMVPVVVVHSILPIVPDDSCNRKEVVVEVHQEHPHIHSRQQQQQQQNVPWERHWVDSILWKEQDACWKMEETHVGSDWKWCCPHLLLNDD